ncbi:MAG: hypothetical protein NPMRIOTA_420010 [Nitrosopumilales archaeon]|nr:MAG: hypothetical protein NPMRIOTA_420010 [Nitrosopumilales archaeon]
MFQFVEPKKDNPSYTKDQTWDALRKAWQSFEKARVKPDESKMTNCAKKIRSLQHNLGINQTKFPRFGLN